MHTPEGPFPNFLIDLGTDAESQTRQPLTEANHSTSVCAVPRWQRTAARRFRAGP